MAMNQTPGPPDEPDEAVEAVLDDERLPCGRLLPQVWDDWEAGVVDPHTRECPHCAAALRDLEMLGDVVRHAQDAASEADGTGPGTGSGGVDAASALTARVMDVVRLELRPGRTLPLGERDEDAWIVEAAAAKAFRAAAEAIPGVRAGSCRIAPLDPAAPGENGAGAPPRGPVRVHIGVAVTLAWTLRDVADQVRARITAAADSALGMEVAAVDVRITDILDEPWDEPSDEPDAAGNDAAGNDAAGHDRGTTDGDPS